MQHLPALVWMYLATGLLWSGFILRVQHRLYDQHTSGFQYLLVMVFNLLLWPLAILACIWLCPIPESRGKRR